MEAELLLAIIFIFGILYLSSRNSNHNKSIQSFPPTQTKHPGMQVKNDK